MQISKVQILFLTIFVSMVFFLPSALGHKTIFVDRNTSSYLDAVEINDVRVSNAIYDELPSGKYVRYFKFRLKPDEIIKVDVLVPKLEGYENFNVGLVLMTEQVAKTFPRVPVNLISTEEISAVDYESEERIVFYEPFTQTSYYQRQSFNLTTRNESEYYMAVFDRNAAGGKYVLAIGNDETFGPADLLLFPYNFSRVRIWYNDYAPALVFASLVILIAGFVLHKKTRIFKVVWKWVKKPKLKLKSKLKKKSKE